MHYDRTVIGYHGCSEDTAATVLGGGAFKQSENSYDWLGSGIYFWEYGLDRAWRWAQEHCDRPAVVGAVIQLGECFDLMDTRFTDELSITAIAYVQILRKAGKPIPQNRGADMRGRYFDCAIVNLTLDLFAGSGVVYQCVRCGFSEGKPVYDDGTIRSALHMESHVQIAVRDPSCIIGTFRPTDYLPGGSLGR